MYTIQQVAKMTHIPATARLKDIAKSSLPAVRQLRTESFVSL